MDMKAEVEAEVDMEMKTDMEKDKTMENKIKDYIEYLKQRIERAESPAVYSERIDIYTKAKEYLVNEAEEIGEDCWESVPGEKIKSNWRLPNTNELFNLLDSNPDIEKNIYWSASRRRYFDNYILVVDFRTAKYVNTTDNDMNYTICIRELDDGKIQWSKPSREKMTWNEALEYANKLNKEEN